MNQATNHIARKFTVSEFCKLLLRFMEVIGCLHQHALNEQSRSKYLCQEIQCCFLHCTGCPKKKRETNMEHNY